MYDLGCSIALLMWIGSMIWVYVSLNSQLERNLNKVGSRQSWLSLHPKPMENNYRQRSILRTFGKMVVFLSVGLIGILFSWLYVAWFVGSVAYSRFKDAGAPQVIREFRWRMRNRDLSFDEIVQGMALAADNKTPVQELRDQIWNEMVERRNA